MRVNWRDARLLDGVCLFFGPSEEARQLESARLSEGARQ